MSLTHPSRRVAIAAALTVPALLLGVLAYPRWRSRIETAALAAAGSSLTTNFTSTPALSSSEPFTVRSLWRRRNPRPWVLGLGVWCRRREDRRHLLGSDQ